MSFKIFICEIGVIGLFFGVVERMRFIEWEVFGMVFDIIELKCWSLIL